MEKEYSGFENATIFGNVVIEKHGIVECSANLECAYIKGKADLSEKTIQFVNKLGDE